MRTFFTALAFLVILLAVIPAVRRSIYTRDTRQQGNEPEETYHKS